METHGSYNRYLSHSAHNSPDVLKNLDEIVWNIRRYCKYIADRGIGCSEKVDGIEEAIINDINAQHYKDNPTKYKLTGGELEKVLKLDIHHLKRQALVQDNYYYYGDEGVTTTGFKFSSSEIPPHSRDWFTEENLNFLKQYVKI